MWSQNGRLVPLPAEQLVVRELVQAFLECGGRIKATAQALNSKGRTTRRGGSWTDTAVGRVLAQENLAALLQEDLWLRCQAKLAERDGIGRRPNRRAVHPLRGVIHCGCGGRMYLRLSGSVAKYVCRMCRERITQATLDRLFAESLASIELPAQEVVAACTEVLRASELSRGLGRRPVRLSEIWPSLDVTERRQVVDLLISQLVVAHDEIIVLLAVSGDPEGESAGPQAKTLPSSHSLRPVGNKATAVIPQPEQQGCIEPKAYRIQQVADLLSCPKSTIYDLVRTGTLASVRTGDRGGVVLVPASAVEEFLERRKARR